ncbi:alpha/beta hydrolase [Microbacterium sp. gxy059]
MYLAAFVPDVGESCATLGGPDAPVNAWIRPFSDGFTYVPEDVAPGLFYGDCTPSAARDAASLLVPQAAGHGRGEVSTAAWRHVRSLYVVCTQDRATSPDLQRRMASRCSAARVFDASHSPYISRPQAIADANTEFAAA